MEKVVKLLKKNKAEMVDAVLDASFIKAWSIRDSRDSRKATLTLKRGLEERVEHMV